MTIDKSNEPELPLEDSVGPFVEWALRYYPKSKAISVEHFVSNASTHSGMAYTARDDGSIRYHQRQSKLWLKRAEYLKAKLAVPRSECRCIPPKPEDMHEGTEPGCPWGSEVGDLASGD